MAERYLRHSMPVVGPGVRTGHGDRMDNPREVGADRLGQRGRRHDASATPAWWSTSAPRSPTTASRATGEYLGGIIAPGVEISMEALTARAAKLPKIDLAPPRSLIAKSTVGGDRAGVIFGFAAQVDGIVGPPARRAGRDDPRVIATGGLAGAIVPFCETIEKSTTS
jgi:type III pantothenate kinase